MKKFFLGIIGSMLLMILMVKWDTIFPEKRVYFYWENHRATAAALMNDAMSHTNMDVVAIREGTDIDQPNAREIITKNANDYKIINLTGSSEIRTEALTKIVRSEEMKAFVQDFFDWIGATYDVQFIGKSIEKDPLFWESKFMCDLKIQANKQFANHPMIEKVRLVCNSNVAYENDYMIRFDARWIRRAYVNFGYAHKRFIYLFNKRGFKAFEGVNLPSDVTRSAADSQSMFNCVKQFCFSEGFIVD